VNYSNVETITTSDGSFNPGEIGTGIDDPTATDDAYTTNEDTPLTTGNVLTNDTDLDGDTLSVDSFTQPTHGTVAYNNDGTFTYTPTGNYHGSDSFTYTVTDSNGGTDTATVTLHVQTVEEVETAPDDGEQEAEGPAKVPVEVPVDEGLAVAADEAAIRDAGVEAEQLIGHAEKLLGDDLGSQTDGSQTSEAAQLAELPPSGAGARGRTTPDTWEVETEVVATGNLDPATYTHTSAQPAEHAADTGRPPATASNGSVVSKNDDGAGNIEEPAPRGLAASLWGLMRAIGGTRRTHDQATEVKSRDGDGHRR
jgi:hypothetical protein